jgi:integrase
MKSRRRGQSEGSIFQRRDGRWCEMLSLGFENGKRKRKSFLAATAAEVRERLLKARADQSHGLPIAIERQTVAQFLTRWLEDSARPAVRGRTFVNYEQLVRTHLVPTLGRIQLDKLTPSDIQKLLNQKTAAGFSARTVRHIHGMLRHAIAQALKWSLVSRNVATLVELPRLKRAPARPFSMDEARRFLTVAQGERLEALYAVALSLGLRQGEALGLRWQDVDLDTGSLSVNQALQRIKGAIGFVEPKSDRSRRKITMPQSAIALLRQHKARQIRERLLAGAWTDFGLVFTSRLGTPLEPRNVFRDFKRLLAKADLPISVRFHDLRHSCATLLLSQGASPRTIMEILGHSQISVTMNTYAHVLPELLSDAADRMDVILFGGKGN